MSSIISTSYDALIVRLEATLPYASGYFRLTNPYDISDNSDTKLKKGWGIAIKSANNANRLLSCQLTQDRNFDLVLTREVLALEDDVVSKSTSDKSIMEDLLLVIKDFETNVTLNAGQSIFTYESDTGVESYKNNNFRFIALSATFSIKLFVDLNS